MLMTSNIEQLTNSFWVYCPPPHPLNAHTHARARSQWRQRLRLLHSPALRGCDGEAICVNPDQTALSGAG